jgi:hypothetical protein
MAGSHDDAVLMIELAKWGAMIGLGEASRTIYADDFDPDTVEANDPPIQTMLVFHGVVRRAWPDQPRESSSEEVAAEVLAEVAPDAVDVRALVGRVVVLEQEGRALDPVVVRVVRHERSRPAQAEPLEACALDPVEAAAGALGREHRGVGRDDLLHEASLGGRQAADEHADRLERRDSRLALRDVVGEALLLEDRNSLLPPAERVSPFRGAPKAYDARRRASSPSEPRKLVAAALIVSAAPTRRAATTCGTLPSASAPTPTAAISDACRWVTRSAMPRP